MPDLDLGQAFPTDDALCERCGYPLRGLSIDAVCPECGLAVAESSPAERAAPPVDVRESLWDYPAVVWHVLRHPTGAFRHMRIDGGNGPARRFLAMNCFFAAGVWALIMLLLSLARRELNPPGLVFMLSYAAMLALTYIEMLGVTAFSRRRGWRVPFHLAERVCCFASVGWLPGMLVAGLGAWLLDALAGGSLWFEGVLGLVKVSWLCYGGLFVLSLLWFETLVWVGVRQVKYANAWSQ